MDCGRGGAALCPDGPHVGAWRRGGWGGLDGYRPIL
jgi:hypothetical protein